MGLGVRMGHSVPARWAWDIVSQSNVTFDYLTKVRTEGCKPKWGFANGRFSWNGL